MEAVKILYEFVYKIEKLVSTKTGWGKNELMVEIKKILDQFIEEHEKHNK